MTPQYAGMDTHLNPAFIEEVSNEPGPKAAVDSAAAQGETHTRAIAWQIADTGAYARSITRTGSTVSSSDPAAVYIEFGSRNNPPFAPLRRGADEAGLKVSH